MMKDPNTEIVRANKNLVKQIKTIKGEIFTAAYTENGLEIPIPITSGGYFVINKEICTDMVADVMEEAYERNPFINRWYLSIMCLASGTLGAALGIIIAIAFNFG